MKTNTSQSTASDCPNAQDLEAIRAIEARLPSRCGLWCNDAQANGESVGDAGAEIIDALVRRFGWERGAARETVNALVAAYGCEQRYFASR